MGGSRQLAYGSPENTIGCHAHHDMASIPMDAATSAYLLISQPIRYLASDLPESAHFVTCSSWAGRGCTPGTTRVASYSIVYLSCTQKSCSTALWVHESLNQMSRTESRCLRSPCNVPTNPEGPFCLPPRTSRCQDMYHVVCFTEVVLMNRPSVGSFANSSK